MAEQPLNNRVPITNQDGTPTQYFIRLLQERGFTVDDKITAAQAQALIDAWAAARDIFAGTGLSGGGNLSADVTINLDASLDDLNDVDFSTPPTSGDALTYDGTNWVPGAVAGGLDVQEEGSSVVNPATAINFIGSAVTVTDGGGGVADVTITGGGGGGGWVLLTSWDYSVDGSTSGVIGNVTGYTEALIEFVDVSTTSSGRRIVRVSTDGGSSYYSGSSDYQYYTTAGIGNNQDALYGHATNSSAIRVASIQMFSLSVTGPAKTAFSITQNVHQAFKANTSPITHIKAMNTAGDLKGGYVRIWAR